MGGEFSDFEECHSMPARGTKEPNWKTTQLSNGPKCLDAKIKRRSKQMKEASCGGIGKQDCWIVLCKR